MVCSSPACPPQATLTDVSDGIRYSCVPSAVAGGSSPISQFGSIFKWGRFIPKSAPQMSIRCKKFFLLSQQGSRRFPVNPFESNLIPRPKLPQAVKIRRNHIGNLWIAPCRLLLHKKNYGLASLRHLNRAKQDALGNHLPTRRHRDYRALHPTPHPIASLAYTVPP